MTKNRGSDKSKTGRSDKFKTGGSVTKNRRQRTNNRGEDKKTGEWSVQ